VETPDATESHPRRNQGSQAGAGATVNWEVTVEANRPFYVFNHAIYEFDEDDHEFPGSYPPRVIPLSGPIVVIGRRHRRPGAAYPEIDLREAPEDRLVSHMHAILDLQPDGTCTLTDRESANGTFINASTTPTRRDVPIQLSDGDRIYVGGWTRILLRAR
jgi:hypothetical protein